MDRVDVLGIKIDGLTMGEAVGRVETAIAKNQHLQVVTLNAEILYRALTDDRLREVISRAGLVTPDGTGIVWAAKKLGQPVAERVAGVDLMQNLLTMAPARGWKVYLYGAKPEVLSLAKKKMEELYPNIKLVGAVDGYIDETKQKEMFADIRLTCPDLLLVALGAPAQEYFIDTNLPSLPPLVAVGVGGSFDVLSGMVRRAPLWVQKLRLEWLYRAGFSWARWKRLAVLPRFVWRVGKESKQIPKA